MEHSDSLGAVSTFQQRIAAAQAAMDWVGIHRELDGVDENPDLVRALELPLMQLYKAVTLFDVQERIVDILARHCAETEPLMRFLDAALQETLTARQEAQLVSAIVKVGRSREAVNALKRLEVVPGSQRWAYKNAAVAELEARLTAAAL